jgi:hypothetical protein
MGKKGHIRDGPSPNAQELDKEPEPQDEKRRKADEFYEYENKHQGENPGVGEEQQVGPQDPGYGAAGPDHGDGRTWVGKYLGQGGRKTTDQVEKKEAEMAQRIFDVIPEDPEVEHVSEEVEEPSVEKHGGKNGQGERDPRELMEDLPVNDLVRDRPPPENKILALHDIQGDLVEKDQAIGQDQADGNQGKG